MEEKKEQQQGEQVNKDYVIQSLTQRASVLIQEGSYKDAIITQQNLEIQELKKQLEEQLLKGQKSSVPPTNAQSVPAVEKQNKKQK